MDIVTAPPEVIGRERQRADHPADPIVRAAIAEEGAMTAVVLNQEEAHKEAGGRHGDEQRYPIAKVQGDPHQDPAQNKGAAGDGELERTAAGARLPIAL